MNYQKIIESFGERRILIIGDLILDHYIWGKVRRISPEAPVPVVEVTRESFMLGGAANVAHNIVAMGGKASVVGMGGRDMAGKTLVDMLTEKGVDCNGIFTENRPTTVKTRVIAHNQQVVRFDREDSKYVGGTILKGVTEYIKSVGISHDAIIVSDYKKGMVSRELITGILRNTKSGKSGSRREMFVAVDPKIGHFDLYRGVSLITPNIMEASSGSSIDIYDQKTLLRAGKALMRKLGCAAVLITRGEQGMSLFERSAVTHIPTVARKVYDVTGAGDTVISAFTLAQASGASMEEAAVLANHAAGVVVGEVGTAVASPEQILKSFESED
ncbi:MAG: D-glycero-beta-D-manno-heptose-7-phosphate kinase [Thermodesulfovibrionales bacterium]